MLEVQSIKPEWLSVTDAAVYSGLSDWTVRDQIRRGVWLAKKHGKRVLVNRPSIDAAIAALPPAAYAPLKRDLKAKEAV